LIYPFLFNDQADREQNVSGCFYFYFLFTNHFINFSKHMKTLKFIMAVTTAIISATGLFAQSHDHSKMVANKTETIKVWGNCDMCKARIEKAAKVEGVTKADWNPDTKILALTYNPSVITSDEVQKRIAAVGHDTEKYRADDKVYDKLPACCHYERMK
jgi:periplasmic mercuric ion binding protein